MKAWILRYCIDGQPVFYYAGSKWIIRNYFPLWTSEVGKAHRFASREAADHKRECIMAPVGGAPIEVEFDEPDTGTSVERVATGG